VEQTKMMWNWLTDGEPLKEPRENDLEWPRETIIQTYVCWFPLLYIFRKIG